MQRLVRFLAVWALACLPMQAQHLRVAFVGDPQVDNETELGYARKSIYRELRERKDLDLVVILGDLVNDDVRLLEPSKATLDSLPCPWTVVPGNHDRDYYIPKKGRIISIDGKVDEKRPRDMATFTRVFGGPDTTFVLGGIRFVMMDDVRRLGQNGYEGGFREDQKKWLRKVLEDTPQDMLAVLSVHIPFREFKAQDSLAAVLRTHPKLLMMTGHTHSAARGRFALPGGPQVEEVLAGATCGTFWRGRKDENGIPEARMVCGAPRGYYLADFQKNGKYTLDYKRVGSPQEERLSAWQDGKGKLLLNIYGGSTEGNVSVKIPGMKGWLPVPRREEPAPEVLAIVEFNKTLGRKGRINNPLYCPLRTADSPHVWSVTLPKSFTGSVKVRYSDPSLSFTTTIRPRMLPQTQAIQAAP